MFKKLSILGACLILAATSAVYSAPASALTGWWFASVCSSGPPTCPPPPGAVFFFGGSTHELCLQTLTAYQSTFWAVYPWALTSDCFFTTR